SFVPLAEWAYWKNICRSTIISAPAVDLISAETSFEGAPELCAFTSQMSWLFGAMFAEKPRTVPLGYCRLIVTWAAVLANVSTLLMTSFSCDLPLAALEPVVPSATNHSFCGNCEPMTELAPETLPAMPLLTFLE